MRALRARLSPRAHVDVVDVRPDEEPATALPDARAARVVAAFEDGIGAGALHLALHETATELSPALAFWRELGRELLTCACGATDADGELGDMPRPSSALDALSESAPPMTGAEYLDRDLLGRAFDEAEQALRARLKGDGLSLRDWLDEHGGSWHAVGRVCFHLAENKKDPARPFAFLATYAHRLSRRATVQHLPLARALSEYASARDRPKLLALLEPVKRAAEKSAVVRELSDNGELYQAIGMTPPEALRLLRDAPVIERAGVVVKLPAGWARGAPRARVQVQVGDRAPGALGADALLSFDVGVVVDGERLGRKDVEALLAADEGLALVKGRWVEVEPDKLAALLQRFERAERAAGDGLSFADALRLLSGAASEDADDAEDRDREWLDVVAGRWLEERLAALRAPAALAAADAPAGLSAALRPYQREGVRWLWTVAGLGLGGCLADDMGLGKTLQFIALLLLDQQPTKRGRKKRAAKERLPALVVVPASLVANWQAEVTRFAPSLRVVIAHASAQPKGGVAALAPEAGAADVVITTYGTLTRTAWLRERAWRVVALDEAQAIKNAGTKQARATKQLKAQSRFALTGTPIENNLGELWSLFDFLNPGLLGDRKEFTALTRSLSAREPPDWRPLHALVSPWILRRKKTDKRVITDLPDKTEMLAWCSLSKRQAALYQRSVDELRTILATVEPKRRRGVVLSFLLRFKQICNHPSQHTGDDEYARADSGKLLRLVELCEPIAARQEKALVFTQFREITAPLSATLREVFGAEGVVLHGGTPVKKRARLVERFQQDERVPFFVLSLKAGGTGLNLTAASHVVHFDRWWNPAVEDQATDRAFRIGQQRNVVVHKMLCRGTVEERIDEMLQSKAKLAADVLEDGGEPALTELSDDELLALVSLDRRRAVDDPRAR